MIRVLTARVNFHYVVTTSIHSLPLKQHTNCVSNVKGARVMECDELIGSWRCSKTFLGQRGQCPGLRFDGLFLSFWWPYCKSHRSQVDFGSGSCGLPCLQCRSLYQQQICMLRPSMCEASLGPKRAYREMSGSSSLVLWPVVLVPDCSGLQKELSHLAILHQQNVDNT